MAAKQIVDRIAGKPDEDWSLAQCRVVEHVGETFGLQCHARQGNTGAMRSFEIPLSRQRAFRIITRVLVGFDHVASGIIDANHSVV
jgi:hypothetical protein